jgi:hypothetical protein
MVARGQHLVAVLVLALVMASAGDLRACPMCAESVAGETVMADGSPQPNLPRAYMWSILFMLTMPALVLGVGGGLVVRAIRAADAAHPLEDEALVDGAIVGGAVIDAVAVTATNRRMVSAPAFDAMAGETAIGVSPA